MNEKRDVGAQVLAWWRTSLSARTQSENEDERASRASQTAARTLSAKLRRGVFPAVLFEPETQGLRKQLGLRDNELKRFSYLLNFLGEIREHDPRPLAELLRGTGSEPVLSHMRFRQLVTADDDKRAALLRRAVRLVGGRCNVARLAWDMIVWNEQTRIRWCLDYFDASISEGKAG